MLPLHAFYLFIYISTGSAFSLLVKNSQQLGKFAYEPVAVTLAVELFKLTCCAVWVFGLSNRDIPVSTKLTNLLSKWNQAKLFAIPAGLYCVFNALAFFNLTLVTPPTYRLLINLKVLWSGVLLQCVLGTRLTSRQWLALVILVCACGIEQFDSFDPNTGIFAILSICLQSFCSSLAGVYFQFLLQVKGKETNNGGSGSGAGQELGLWEKNFFMYSWTISLNLIFLAIFRPTTFWNPGAALATFDAAVIPIILTSGIGGFSTALILRDMDVIVKEYANFVEMCVVVIGAWIVLGTPLHLSLFVAVAMVTVSLYLYNVPESTSTASSSATSLPSKSSSASGSGSGSGSDFPRQAQSEIALAVLGGATEGDEEPEMNGEEGVSRRLLNNA